MKLYSQKSMEHSGTRHQRCSFSPSHATQHRMRGHTSLGTHSPGPWHQGITLGTCPICLSFSSQPADKITTGRLLQNYHPLYL